MPSALADFPMGTALKHRRCLGEVEAPSWTPEVLPAPPCRRQTDDGPLDERVALDSPNAAQMWNSKRPHRAALHELRAEQARTDAFVAAASSDRWAKAIDQDAAAAPRDGRRATGGPCPSAPPADTGHRPHGDVSTY